MDDEIGEDRILDCNRGQGRRIQRSRLFQERLPALHGNRLLRPAAGLLLFRDTDDLLYGGDALEFIRLHSCGKIAVQDVVRQMGCSRRFADLRFRATLNRTITDEIHLSRLESAKSLLLHGEAIDAVAEKTGYASAADFRRVFKRYTGISPKQWAKAEKAQ